MKSSHFKKSALDNFEAEYNVSPEDLAPQSRGAFLKAFPVKRLKDLTVDTYVIGLQRRTRQWLGQRKETDSKATYAWESP